MKNYKSKIGLEFVIPLTIIFGSMLYDSIATKKMNMTIIALIAIMFISHMFITTIYRIEQENLKIKCGFFVNLTVDIKSIQKISESYNPISSPAASLDRLEIIYNYGKILISPADKKEFINSLLVINPNIEVNYRKK